jgi:transcription initiation factor TFIIIB Brf1 subunit/transcription initiation factor TFIIB
MDDVFGQIISRTIIGGGKNQLNRLNHQMQSGTQKSVEQNLQMCFTRIRDYCSVLGYTKIVENNAKATCAKFYEELVKEKTDSPKRTKTVGEKKINALVLAILTLSGSNTNVRSIALETDVDETMIRKKQKSLKKVLQKYPAMLGIIEGESQVHNYIQNFADLMNCEYNLERYAKAIATKVQPYFEGKRPSTIASACIVIAVERFPEQNGTYSLESLSTISDLTSNTITTTSDDIKAVLIKLAKMEAALRFKAPSRLEIPSRMPMIQNNGKRVENGDQETDPIQTKRLKIKE